MKAAGLMPPSSSLGWSNAGTAGSAERIADAALAEEDEEEDEEVEVLRVAMRRLCRPAQCRRAAVR